MRFMPPILSLIVLCGVLAVAAWLMPPLPLPAAGAAFLGWLGFWIRVRRRFSGAIAGALLGATVGASLHAYAHVSEDRVETVVALVLHLLADVGLALLIAAAALALALLTAKPLVRNARREDGCRST
jgi:hypothetical protein